MFFPENEGFDVEVKGRGGERIVGVFEGEVEVEGAAEEILGPGEGEEA